MTQPTSNRRQLLGSIAAAVTTAAVAAATIASDRARRTTAASPTLAAATVDERAVRLAVTTTTTPPTVPTRPPAKGTLRFPIDPRPDCDVLDNFGDCRSDGTRAHLGVDIMATRGREIYAVRSGVLSDWFENTGTAGFGWTLRGDDGVVYRYMHLDGFAPGLVPATRVTEGQLVGFVGSTGNDSNDNVHLHFEVRIDGLWVDPLPLLALPPEARVGPPLKDCIGLVN
jgi:peptidoglycan LD-endopeptidase LytH